MTAARLGAILENCARHRRYLKASIARLPSPLAAGHLAGEFDALVAALGWMT